MIPAFPASAYRSSDERIGSRQLLAVLYFVLALATVIRTALVTPPFQVADEGQHFLRAVQVGSGGLVAVKDPHGVIGGMLPGGASDLALAFGALRFQAHAVGTPAMACAAATTRWQSRNTLQTFANTAIYPPFFYLPAASAIDVGRLMGMRIATTLSFARLVDGAAAVALSTAAILMAGAGVPLLAVLLSLPMTLSLFGSCSQDSLLIAVAGLVAAAMSRVGGGRHLSGTAWMLISIGLGALAAARPPYVAFLCLPILLTWHGPQRRQAVFAVAGALIIGGGWVLFGTAGLMTPTRAGGSLFDGGQAHFIRNHPATALAVIPRTLREQGAALWQQFVGVLDWLDVLLPSAAYSLLSVAVLIGLLLCFPDRNGHTARPPLAIAGLTASLIAACLLIMILQYLSWTAAGAAVVEGIQGRYFIPVALMAVVLMRPDAVAGIRMHLTTILLVAVLGVDLISVPTTIAGHYAISGCHS